MGYRVAMCCARGVAAGVLGVDDARDGLRTETFVGVHGYSANEYTLIGTFVKETADRIR